VRHQANHYTVVRNMQGRSNTLVNNTEGKQHSNQTQYKKYSYIVLAVQVVYRQYKVQAQYTVQTVGTVCMQYKGPAGDGVKATRSASHCIAHSAVSTHNIMRHRFAVHNGLTDAPPPPPLKLLILTLVI
jgi:hypothetical protein